MNLTYGQLKALHPESKPALVEQYRALATGGDALLSNTRVMTEVFPQHANEPAWVYAQRKRRAIYIPYAGEIIGELCAQLGCDPVTISNASLQDASEFYDEFAEDVDNAGTPLMAFLQEITRDALIDRVVWTRVDLPEANDTVTSLKEQEDSGSLRAYLRNLDTVCVPDYEEAPDGTLLWACVHSQRSERPGPEASRAMITERWVYYYPDHWDRYEITYSAKKPPSPKTEVRLIATGTHSFGAVPLVRFQLPDGLWAMDKIASLVRGHFNLCSAIDWSQNKHLFPMMMAFLAPTLGGDEVDSGKATSQTYGTGFINTFGDKDRIEYITPDPSVYQHAQERLASLRDEIHRVCHAMALSVDNSAGAMGRSGDSKAEDRVAKEVIAREVGRLLREHVKKVLALVAAGRGDALDEEWHVGGIGSFDPGDEADAVNDGIAAQMLEIDSPTFRVVTQTAIAKRMLKRHATAEQMTAIEKEIAASAAKPAIAPTTDTPPPASTEPSAQDPASGDAAPTTDAPPAPIPTGAAAVADTALNGAQVSSLIDLLVAASTGSLPIDTVEAMARAAFPSMPSDVIAGMFAPVRKRGVQAPPTNPSP